ncbi:MAG TPA: sigma factor [Terriglobales bacterium]|nr:sigma factor [Terriglobales bacterium]
MITETAPSLNAFTTVANTSSMQWSEAEFEAVFLEHYPRVTGVLLRLLGDRTRAEELANDVFLRLYRTASRGEVDGKVGGWLYRTATNAGIDALRAVARRRKYENEAARLQESPAESPLDEMVREERRRKVRTVLAG